MEKMEKIKELKKLVTVRKVDGDEIECLFVDIKNSQGCDVYAKPGILEKKISENDLKKELFECIEQLADMNDPLIMKNKSDLDVLLKNNSHYIASNGKLGEATHLLISKENYNEYNVEKLLTDDLKDINLVFSDSIKDIILYRVNSFDQPGLVLIHNKDKYVFEGIGFYPQRQFQKILICGQNKNTKEDIKNIAQKCVKLAKNLPEPSNDKEQKELDNIYNEIQEFGNYLTEITTPFRKIPTKMDDLKKDFMEKLIQYCKTSKNELIDFESFKYIKVNVEFFKDKPSDGFSFWFDNEK